MGVSAKRGSIPLFGLIMGYNEIQLAQAAADELEGFRNAGEETAAGGSGYFLHGMTSREQGAKSRGAGSSGSLTTMIICQSQLQLCECPLRC